MQKKPEMKKMDKMDDAVDDQQSDDLSLSIPLPPTPASVVCCAVCRSFI